MEDTSLNSSSQQVVGSSDGVDITSQVQVELVHGNDLRVTTASGATLDTESRTLTGLTDVGKGDSANVGTKSLSQAHGGGRLTLSERSGGNTSNNNVFTVLAVLQTVDQ